MADYAPVDLTAENQVTFELNGQKVSAPAGTMLVDACYALGVEVPIFCYEPRIGPPVGACRMCLVEIEGMRGLQTACSTPVAADMVVHTNSPLARDGQEGVLELLLANHPLDCPVCDKGGECPLQDRTFRFGPGRTRFVDAKRHFPKPLELSSRIALDRERCIACFRCVRFSQEVSQDGQLTMQERGARSEVATFTGDPYEARFTGNVIDVCPVGALTSIPYRFVARPWDITNTPSVCGLCAVGCNTELTLREGEVKRITGRDDPNYAVEEGWLCDVGRWAYDGGDHDSRLTASVVRDAAGERVTDLTDALAAATAVLSDAPRVGVLLGPTATVEEATIALDMARDAFGEAVVARLGVPAGPLAALRAEAAAQMVDIDRADVIVVVGGDPCRQQPVVELRLRKAALRRRARVITIGRPSELNAIGEHIDAAPGELVTHIARIGELISSAAHPVVLWDEADVAAEPAAAAALAAVLDANGAARQLELGCDANGAGLRAMGIRAIGLREELLQNRLSAVITVHADPCGTAGAQAWQSALDASEVPVVAIATHRTATTDRATVVLPAFTMWEHDGTLVNMTQRAQRVRRGGGGPEGAAAGWEILIALAHRLGAPLAYRTPATALEAAGQRYSGLAGITYTALGDEGVVLPRPGRDHLADDVGAQQAASLNGLTMLTSRDVYGGAAAERSQALHAFHVPRAVVMGPETAATVGVAGGDTVTLSSPHGTATMPLAVVEGALEGCVVVPIGAAEAVGERLMSPEHGPVRVEVRKG